MSIITRMRKQVAVAWLQNGASPDADGQPVVGSPVEISCRWEDKVVEFIGKDGTRQMSSAVVYVDRDMETGDLLRLGPLSSLTDAGTGSVHAKNNTGVSEVRRFDKLPNIRNSENLRTCFL